jgi:hypothetical protein
MGAIRARGELGAGRTRAGELEEDRAEGREEEHRGEQQGRRRAGEKLGCRPIKSIGDGAAVG